MKLLSPILALIWGVLWAFVLQTVPLGKYLAARRTWLTVIAGVGVDLLLLRPLLSLGNWLRVIGVVAASAVGIVARSLYNEWRDHQAWLTHAGGRHS